jgi:3-oxoacyl-[acyl-carrier protein] reductase
LYRLEKANSVVAEIQAAGGDAIVFGGDITAQDYPKDLIKKTIDTYGKLNHLCLVAGFTADKVRSSFTLCSSFNNLIHWAKMIDAPYYG